MKTRRMREPKLDSWRALRAKWLSHVSSRMQIRLLTMTRVGTLPIEDETGRWSKIEKAERTCKDCKAALGTTQHFLRECTALSTPTVPSWLQYPQEEKLHGHWWRDVARKLEVRWREKCTMHVATHENAMFAVLAEKILEEDLYYENTDVAVKMPNFINPGDKIPDGIEFEVFTDGSKTPGLQSAGWGFWVGYHF